MKQVLAPFLTLAFVGSIALAKDGTEINCDFSHVGNFKGISIIKMISGNPGTVEVSYVDGSKENLSPIAGVGGLFEQIQFSSVIADNNDSRSFTFLDLDTNGSKLNNLQIAYACNQAFTTFCVGFSGDSTPIARVHLNLDGTVIKFNGGKLPYCSRK